MADSGNERTKFTKTIRIKMIAAAVVGLCVVIAMFSNMIISSVENNIIAIKKKEASDKSGSRLMLNATAIQNKKECHGCHDQKNRNNGMLPVSFDIADTEKAISDNKKALVFLACFSIATAALITTVLFTKLVVKPVRGILDGMSKAEKGELDIKIPVDRNDEIGMLADGFNKMLASMKEHKEKLIKDHIKERMTLFSICEVLNRAESIDDDVRLILDSINIGFGVKSCSLIVLSDIGAPEVKGAIGLNAEDTENIRRYIGEIFMLNSLSDSDSSVSMEKYKDKLQYVQKIKNGEVFVAEGSEGIIGSFLVVPLKAANTVKGALTIHEIEGRDIRNSDMREIFSIVASAIAPYFLVGLQIEDRKRLKTTPYRAYLELVKDYMRSAAAYNRPLSLVIVKTDNYIEVCNSEGVEEASRMLQETCAAISSKIETVHHMTRITEIRFVTLLPMLDKQEAVEKVNNAIAQVEGRFLFECKVIVYPEDGATAEKLMFLSYA